MEIRLGVNVKGLSLCRSRLGSQWFLSCQTVQHNTKLIVSEVFHVRPALCWAVNGRRLRFGRDKQEQQPLTLKIKLKIYPRYPLSYNTRTDDSRSYRKGKK